MFSRDRLGHPCRRRRPATLHGVVFDILVGSAAQPAFAPSFQSVFAFAPLKLRRTPRFALRVPRGCATCSPQGEAWWARQDSNLKFSENYGGKDDDQAVWILDVSGQEMVHGFLNASLRDWARFGRLLANDGNWGAASWFRSSGCSRPRRCASHFRRPKGTRSRLVTLGRSCTIAVLKWSVASCAA